jgi:hypothetical protein
MMVNRRRTTEHLRLEVNSGRRRADRFHFQKVREKARKCGISSHVTLVVAVEPMTSVAPQVAHVEGMMKPERRSSSLLSTLLYSSIRVGNTFFIVRKLYARREKYETMEDRVVV